MNEKDKKIIEDAEKEGIPVFVFTAKDKLSPNVLVYYGRDCINAHCTKEHIRDVYRRENEFRIWQLENPEIVKLPD